MNINDIELHRTCYACPEQYNAINKITNEMVGYLRLRHGHFTVEVPDVFGKLVYESYPKGDGIFEEDERTSELTNAILAIADYYGEE